MTDLGPLHRRLLRALDVSSLVVLAAALAPGCATTHDEEVAKVGATKTDATRLDPPQPDATPDATSGGPPPAASTTDPPAPDDTKTTPSFPIPEVSPVGMNMPSCPTIDWCGSKALVEAMRHTSSAPSADVEGCPSMVERKAKLPGKLLRGQPPPPAGTLDSAGIDAGATALARADGKAESCCYEWTVPCPGGRPLLVDGRPWLAGLRPGRGWSVRLPELSRDAALPDALRERIADAWLRDALTEHASIASFVRARAELAAISAPAELLRACDRAAADEVEHARLCFSLAERVGGRALEPTELPAIAPRGGDALAVALDTFVEGCVGETIAAACARRAAATAVDPTVRAVLERIADDETEHAALAWRTLAWLAARDGAPVLAAVSALAEQLRPRASEETEEDSDATVLRAHGRLDARAQARTRRRAWRELVDPLLAALRAGMQQHGRLVDHGPLA